MGCPDPSKLPFPSYLNTLLDIADTPDALDTLPPASRFAEFQGAGNSRHGLFYRSGGMGRKTGVSLG